jgi:hypothetical protein
VPTLLAINKSLIYFTSIDTVPAEAENIIERYDNLRIGILFIDFI